jgi:hypothetical protein
MNMRRYIAMLLFGIATTPLLAQWPSSVSTHWDDSFVAWEVFAPVDSMEDEDGKFVVEETQVGELKLRWLNIRDDWSEWDFDILGVEGTIRAKWKDDPTQWELRDYNGTVVTMRTAWGKDMNEWRVTDNNIALSLKSRWTNQADEWIVEDPTYGKFYMYTLQAGNPRDWAIEDTLLAEVTPAMRYALMFLVVYHSSPRQ